MYYFTFIGLVVILVDYFIIIERFYGGQHFPLSIADISTYTAALILSGFLSNYMHVLLNTYFENLSKESQKVQILNDSLSQKVEERTQALAQQNDELQKANYELDKFVYKVSHDLRAPLLSSVGLVELIRNAENPEERTNYCDMMGLSLNKLDNLIKDILDLSQNARSELVYAPVNLRQLIEGVFAQHKQEMEQEQIHAIIDIKGDDFLVSDEKRLAFVFRNLISNSVRYHTKRAAPSFIRITVNNPIEKSCHIQVCDNGQGIEEAHLSKIFDMFYRATQNKPGSGLGLYIVKETLQRLEGTIRVQSSLDEGTCFDFALPPQSPSVPEEAF